MLHHTGFRVAAGIPAWAWETAFVAAIFASKLSCYSPAMTARRHHFISQCYLNRFAVLRKAGKYQIRVFDHTTAKTFLTAVENVGLERDFNRIEVEGHPPDAFEAGVAAFESELAPALERTAASCAFANDVDKNLILNLIGTLALRNPRWREAIRQMHEHTAKSALDVAFSSKERWEEQRRQEISKGNPPPDGDVTFEDMKKFHEEGNYQITLDTGYHLRVEMESLDMILPLLAKRRWVFLRAPKDSGCFVTSDHPVSLIWSKGGQPPNLFHSPGFGLPGTEVVFPVSPRVVLLGAFEQADHAQDVTEAAVAMANAITANFATRQVYARDMGFQYQFPDAPMRKASALIDDANFLRKREPSVPKRLGIGRKRAPRPEPASE